MQGTAYINAATRLHAALKNLTRYFNQLFSKPIVNASKQLRYSRAPMKRPPIKRPPLYIRRPVLKVLMGAFLLFLRLLSGQPPLSGHYPFPRGWPFNRS